MSQALRAFETADFDSVTAETRALKSQTRDAVSVVAPRSKKPSEESVGQDIDISNYGSDDLLSLNQNLDDPRRLANIDKAKPGLVELPLEGCAQKHAASKGEKAQRSELADFQERMRAALCPLHELFTQVASDLSSGSPAGESSGLFETNEFLRNGIAERLRRLLLRREGRILQATEKRMGVGLYDRRISARVTH